MKTEQPILITSITATEDIPKHRFVTVLGGLTPALDVEQTPLGVCNADTKQGEQCPVMVQGIALVEVTTGLDVGSTVAPTTDGKITSEVGNLGSGITLDASVNDGDLVRVLLTPIRVVSAEQ